MFPVRQLFIFIWNENANSFVFFIDGFPYELLVSDCNNIGLVFKEVLAIRMIRLKIRRHVLTLGSDVEHDQSRDHVYDSPCHEKRINDQKYRVNDRCSSVCSLWEQEVEYSFSEEDNHHADSNGRPVEILFRVDHADRIQADQGIEQQCNTDPDKHCKGNPCGFFRIHHFLSYKKRRLNKNFFAKYFELVRLK